MKLGKHEIKDELLTNYNNHFDADKTDIYSWEKERKKLHLALFESVGLQRFSQEGGKLSKAIDKYCIPIIEKKDYFVAGLKKIGIAKNESEMAMAKLNLENRRMFEVFEKAKKERENELFEKAKSILNTCRVCDKELKKGVARINDHLQSRSVDRAICMNCSNNNPDDHIIEFKAKYWNK